MIPKGCKRLAEVDFPIAVVSKHSAREKSIRHGHPSTLHLWWARRPLAACRAMLLALLLPDPCDPECPEDFKLSARESLRAILGVHENDEGLRKALLTFIGDVANWDVANHPRWIGVARELVKAAYGDEAPLVVDPFAGGGSIPLEALRLGCEAFASDLNPVACLILKTMLEDIPRHGPKLADELRRVGAEIKQAAERELAEFYPTDPDGATPIAYLWARTVRCESPTCGAEIPLVRSFWLCKKPNRRRALRSKVIRTGEAQHVAPSVEFEIFEPKTDGEVQNGSVSLAKALCPCCQIPLSRQRLRSQLAARRFGTEDSRLLAIISLQENSNGRRYRLPTDRDLLAVRRASAALAAMSVSVATNGLSPVPDEILPKRNTRNSGFGPRLYGAVNWGDIFSARQKLALVTLAAKIQTLPDRASEERALKALLAIVLDRCADRWSTICRLDVSRDTVTNTFSRQALPITWDYCEAQPFSSLSGGYDGALDWVVKVVELLSAVKLPVGQVQQSDALESPLPDETAGVWFTDPPYYDSVAYADLSDFFFVWLKRTLPGYALLQDPFDPENPVTPKDRECIENQEYEVGGRPKDKRFFEDALKRSFAEGRRILRSDGIGCVVFAHKSTEGWEALLSGILRAGWVITASWPITTEMSSRLVARNTAALEASIHLVCRPRSEDAPIGDWTDVRRELQRRISDWMERLIDEHVRGADLVFACIGPAMEVYSRYLRVEDAEGHEIPLGGDPTATEPHKRGFLSYVWETVGRIALEQVLGTAEARARNGAAGVLEEDARLTALFLWTLQSTDIGGEKANSEEMEEEELSDDEDEGSGNRTKRKGFTLIYDVARRFAQPLGIHLEQWEDRIIMTEKGVVRLLPVSERAKQLFGQDGAAAVADQLEERTSGPVQLKLFTEKTTERLPAIRGHKRGKKAPASPEVPDEQLRSRQEATTLDRVHAGMLLQASGRANALRALLKAEQDRGPDLLRLANALSALYPKESEEKRLLDAMLLAAPR